MTTLTAVDHDPFASQAAKATPVEGDPFSAEGAYEVPQVNFDRPIAEVRADIAKMPEGRVRDAALRQWADTYVAKERADAKTNFPSTGRLAINPQQIADTVRNIARGAPFVGSFADELNAGTSAAAHALTGGAVGAPYDEAVAYQRAVDRALKKEAPTQAAVEELAGGLAGGGPIAKGIISGGRNVVDKALRGGAVGGTYGYVSGFGEGEGSAAQRHEHATSGEGTALGLSPTEMGATGGALLPPAITGLAKVGGKVVEAASPTIARIGANVKEIPRRIGFPASADGAIPETAGAKAAAEQIIANQLSRSGRTVEELRQDLAKVGESAKFHSSGRAQDATALADLDPGLQRLAGSVGRFSPEAANVERSFIQGRQTGISSAEGEAAKLAESGLPTRPMLANPVTGAQAERALGKRFGTPEDKFVPMGQGERVQDALKRAFRLEDEKWHGHGTNALRTDQDILRLAKEEAQKLYGETYTAGGNIDVSSAIAPVLKTWADRITQEPKPVGAAIQNVMRLFFTRDGAMVTNIERFDKAKQFADGVIEKYFQSAEGRNRYLGGVLTELRNDLLKGVKGADGKTIGGVDNITNNGLGEKYTVARGAFGTRMDARNALQMGRDAFKQDSDIGVDAFRSLATEGEQKLFRLGLLSGYEKAAAGMKRGADKTQIFDNPRIQELLSAVIERSKSRTDTFFDRPERFGNFVGNEKRMIETRNVVQGNSATAQRLKDDEAFNIMSKASETLEKFKSSGSLTMVGIRFVEEQLGKLFGMRADTAASIARMLFTADPVTRMQVLNGVERRLGRNRFEQFTKMLDQYQQNIIAAGARQGSLPQAAE